mmetsp:Transcript_28627/g.50901  ORF Transcript_28627/g.50901 Transcript_28627/m.50901 type:complete len:178 (-) Transcript_28627:820-1353(-)
MDSVLPSLLPYFSPLELVQLSLGNAKPVCKSWKDAVDVHLIWKALFSSVCSSTREHFNKLTPQIRVRTVQKPKPALLARPQLAPAESEEKQWIVTPSNLLAKLKFTTINKVGLLKRDPEFMQASSRLMQGWTQNLNSLIGTLLKQADFHSFTEEASYWRDSERVLGLVLEELTVAPT